MGNQDRNQTDAKQVNKNDDSINTKDFLIGALIGGIVGAGTALLLAPKSGKELISDINDQASNLKDKSSHLRDTAMEKGNEFVHAAKEKTNEISQTVSKQSTEIIDKIKQITAQEDAAESHEKSSMEDDEMVLAGGHTVTNENDVQVKLEETKKAFDETEQKVNQ
ncbi:YtxH domain-containing protein [Cytobacillus purgationiresistens]|uniref:Gas vesicle protein n=1 Tax=Cytobacillus purgationiresistens TaxID=863449 RepID=A0ABU0AQ31_9BACI|nr:YtxH domain-containing protein [Cytobacillus purgationiresistens]MDQ0272150.1 gas vesicle protein [Cytobacillus purgationiresistens]